MRAVLKAEIRYNNGLMRTPCVVRDISDTGARLEMAGDIALPDRFDLYIEKKNVTHPVELRWRQAKEVGVAFLDVAAKPAAPADPGLEARVAKLEAEITELRRVLEKIFAAIKAPKA